MTLSREANKLRMRRVRAEQRAKRDAAKLAAQSPGGLLGPAPGYDLDRVSQSKNITRVFYRAKDEPSLIAEGEDWGRAGSAVAGRSGAFRDSGSDGGAEVRAEITELLTGAKNVFGLLKEAIQSTRSKKSNSVEISPISQISPVQPPSPQLPATAPILSRQARSVRSANIPQFKQNAVFNAVRPSCLNSPELRPFQPPPVRPEMFVSPLSFGQPLPERHQGSKRNKLTPWLQLARAIS